MSRKKKTLYQAHTFPDGGLAAGVGIAGTATDLVSNAVKAGKGVDTSEYVDQAQAVGSQGFEASSTDDLLAQWNQRQILNNKTYKDITGNSVGMGVLGSALNVGSAALKGIQATKSPYGALLAIPQLAGEIIGGVKTASRIKDLNRQIDVANFRQDSNFATASDTLENKILNNALANYAAHGGPIHIAASKKGTFTAAATKHGMGVQEFASHVLANKDDYSTAMVKKANFARNASHWHDAGGSLFSNGVTTIGNGDTHENNPFGGVMMGIAPDGLPNLVEEGETIYNNYVFSNRLKVPKAVRNKYKLRGPKEQTFSEAFIRAQKESEERENDPISEAGLNREAMILAQAQENLRIKDSNIMANGGHLFARGSGIDGLNDFDYNYNFEDEPIVVPPIEALNGQVPINLISPVPTRSGVPAPRVTVPKEDWQTPAYEKYKLNEGNRQHRATEDWSLANLRYLAPLSNLSAVGMDLAGKTNTPTRFNYIPNTPKVAFERLGTYMPRAIFDMSYEANQREAQNLAALNALRDSAGANRGANIIQQNYNAIGASGDALNKAFNTQLNSDRTVLDFNRGTNQINSQGDLSAQSTNAGNTLNYANARLNQAGQNENNSNAAWGARAQNLQNLSEALYGIGTEDWNKQYARAAIDSGVFGVLNDLYKQAAARTIGANSGKLKKRGGFTY